MGSIDKETEKMVTITITVPVSEASRLLPGLFNWNQKIDNAQKSVEPINVEENGNTVVVTLPRKKHPGGRPRKNVPEEIVASHGKVTG